MQPGIPQISENELVLNVEALASAWKDRAKSGSYASRDLNGQQLLNFLSEYSEGRVRGIDVDQTVPFKLKSARTYSDYLNGKSIDPQTASAIHHALGVTEGALVKKFIGKKKNANEMTIWSNVLNIGIFLFTSFFVCTYVDIAAALLTGYTPERGMSIPSPVYMYAIASFAYLVGIAGKVSDWKFFCCGLSFGLAIYLLWFSIDLARQETYWGSMIENGYSTYVRSVSYILDVVSEAFKFAALAVGASCFYLIVYREERADWGQITRDRPVFLVLLVCISAVDLSRA